MTATATITDLDLPEMPGEQMVPRIREARPGLEVLYASANVDRMGRFGKRTR